MKRISWAIFPVIAPAGRARAGPVAGLTIPGSASPRLWGESRFLSVD